MGEKRLKKLGIIGGMGPLAGAWLFKMIVENTPAERDQDHPEVLLHSIPQIPDRTAYILHPESAENPLPYLLDSTKMLLRGGAECIAIPCVTSYYFNEEICEAAGEVPILHVIGETAAYLAEKGIRRAGIMATDGTKKSELFQKVFAERGIEAVFPDEEGQKKVMRLIYENVKAGRPIETELATDVRDQLLSAGAETVVLGCTELSLIKQQERITEGFTDALEILALACVAACKGD